MESREEIVDDVAVDISETEVAAGVAEGEFFVIETEQPQDCGVQIVDVDFVFDGRKSELIRRAVDIAATDAATRQPHAEAVVVVIAAIDLAGIGAGLGQLNGWRAAEFTAPDHERVL